MAKYIEKAEVLTLPAIALRGIVSFPSITLSFEVTEESSIAAANAAIDTNSFVFLAPTKEYMANDEFDAGKLYGVGTVAKIKQSLKTPEGNMRLIVEGFSRAELDEIRDFANYRVAHVLCKTYTLTDNGGVKGEAYARQAIAAVEGITSFLPTVSSDVVNAAKSIKNIGLLADFIASNILVKLSDKLTVLSIFEPLKRIEALIVILKKETELLSCEFDIHKKVRARINQNQKEYYLREQLKTIEDELGEGGEAEEYEEKILASKLPKEVEEKLLKEASRLSKLPFGSAETSVLRTYLDTCLELPWNNRTEDRLDVVKAKKILDRDHYGLDEVKERILEYLAVKQLNPSLRNQIICLVGPPGVGKTSIGASLAKAMGREYVRVSLGGVRDEADIRGHRKTYIGAMPGRIINAIERAKVNNPLILLDEIDKLTQDAHGDPASALLEVLDAEQNKNFRDHFIELPFDLSDCVFIATANTLDTVPRPLIDRMEVIKLKIYTKREKLSIAKNHLIKKQLTRHGLSSKTLRIADSALNRIIDEYTHEAGVRNLERTIAEICRKAAKKIIDEGASRISVTEKNLSDFLGTPKLIKERISNEDEVGVVNGLAYTELGGSMLPIEVAILDGSGKIELTGSLGDVMQESAKTAISFVRSIAKSYGIAPDFYNTKDIHIHAPEGAVPKDGPSAGVTMVTGLVSALTGRAVKRDVAMTGEISLRGKVLPIGGLKEKTMAAYSAGAKTVLIPKDNLRDLEDIDPLARENLTFIPCKTADDVLRNALVAESAVQFDATMVEKAENAEKMSDFIPDVAKGNSIPSQISR